MRTTPRLSVRVDAIADDVRTYWAGQMRREQVAPPMAELPVLADCLERVVDLVAVGRQLRQTPCFTGVAQDLDEILLRPWGELERQRVTGAHQRLLAHRCAGPWT